MSNRRSAVATARANIALAKYWGKVDTELNLPAVPSISMTLDRLVTETAVSFDERLDEDRVALDGKPASERERERVVELLDRVREAAKLPHRAKVASNNRFPTAAGLASSASGFAALAAAASTAAGLKWNASSLSSLARASSASAARSIFGGFVELPAGKAGRGHLAAKPLFGPEHWDLRMVVAETARGPKAVGSTEGMERSRTSSPYYAAWLELAHRLASTIRRALRDQNLEILGQAMEQSTFGFHACALASDPALLYWRPTTLAALETVWRLRDDESISAWATMDAGPHVKVLCHADDVLRVREGLTKTEGVQGTWITRAGEGVEIR